MQKTQFARKIDSQGRIMIPAKLRDKLSLQTGQELPFFIHQERNQIYLCIRCKAAETEVDNALKILEKNGINITEALDKMR